MSAPHSNQMSAQEALRTFVRTKFAKIVPDRPYARNIEKSVWEWAINETKKTPHPAVWENMWFRNRYKLKATHLMAELQRDPSWITCDLKVSPGTPPCVRSAPSTSRASCTGPPRPGSFPCQRSASRRWVHRPK